MKAEYQEKLLEVLKEALAKEDFYTLKKISVLLDSFVGFNDRCDSLLFEDEENEKPF